MLAVNGRRALDVEQTKAMLVSLTRPITLRLKGTAADADENGALRVVADAQIVAEVSRSRARCRGAGRG